MKTEIIVPTLGEGIKSATVVSILVKLNEEVLTQQPLIEVESEKATLEIPSPFNGKVLSIKVKKGDTLQIGQIILELEIEKDNLDKTKTTNDKNEIKIENIDLTSDKNKITENF